MNVFAADGNVFIDAIDAAARNSSLKQCKKNVKNTQNKYTIQFNITNTIRERSKIQPGREKERNKRHADEL